LSEQGYLSSSQLEEMEMIMLRRVYDHQGDDGGKSFLVERLWSRGVKKEDLHVEAWQKEVAPSTELRKWFNHGPTKRQEFKRRYQAELDRHREAWKLLQEAARQGDITLLFSASDTQHNNALVLKEYLQRHL
jgi:uncharacterized protein YeaO (DUF488 family)